MLLRIDLPKFDEAILTGRCDDVVVERIPANVEDWSSMSGNLRGSLANAAGSLEGQHHKAAATPDLVGLG